ncbi:MAG: DNA polymerase I [Candidatus Omnitrophica bacterium]|nr:DNA polymerase I [Candidatus Omnitrophota bacterium]
MKNNPHVQKTLYLIDGHTLCYRSFYAIRELTNSIGQPTNAVYGFVNILRKIIRDFAPEYLAVCFDAGKKTHRQATYAEYKIQRPSMPEELRSQIPLIKQVVDGFNVPIFEMEGFEADDIIGTLTQQASAVKMDVVVVTEDKDLFQLAREGVRIYSARKDEIFDAAALKTKLGFDPKLMPEYIGLAGDASDNIPGVKGIGAVTATKLIREFGDLDRILAQIETVEPPRIRHKIVEQKDNALLSRDLARLMLQVPFRPDWEDLKVKAPDGAKLFKLFKELEFAKWAQEFQAQEAEITVPAAPVVTAPLKNFAELADQIKRKGRFAFLLDAPDNQRMFAEGIALVVEPGQVIRMDVSAISDLLPILADPGILKITHDVKAVKKYLIENNKDREDKTLLSVFDALLAAYLLNPGQASFQIPDLVWEYLKFALPENAHFSQKADGVARLYEPLRQELKAKELIHLLDDIELPLTDVLARMEIAGVKIDVDYLSGMSRDCEAKIQDLTKNIFRAAGEEFNLNSPKQLSQVLFEKLKLPPVKKTKTGFSTDEEVLQSLAAQHDVPAMILEYRQIAKLKSTYIDALPALVNPSTGRIHAVFDQTGTETGRLSSSHPNLQNIPVRTEMGRQIRKAFIAESDGWALLAADYSQIELRILAHLSGDRGLTKAFAEGQDIHQYTASLVFDVPERQVTPEMRYAAKRINFGIIYGMSAFGLAKDLALPQAEAQQFIDKYFSRYPDVKAFMEGQIKFCDQHGYVVTLLNRRRYIPEIHSANGQVRQFAQRQAINAPVQGSAADLIKRAMIDVSAELLTKKMRSRMIITVHDELVFEAPETEAQELARLVRTKMEKAIQLKVPLVVSLKKGINWLEMREFRDVPL